MTPKLSLFLAAAALLAFANIPALALTVPVAQDTSSSEAGNLTSKAGKAASLKVGDDQTALIEFDLSNLDVVPATIDPGNIKSVILDLYVIKANPPGDLTVHAVTSPWTETFAAKTAPPPSIDSTVLATIPMARLPVKAKGFVSVDITAPVVAALASGSNLSLAIETSTHGANVVLGSKDGPAAGYGAVLDIEAGLAGTEGPAGPPDNLTIGTVTSGAAPAITLTGSSPNQILNFTLAQGPMGPTGPTGPIGLTGATGLTGLAGATGPAGPADNLMIGTVTGGAAIGVTISGASPNQTLNFAIPDGQLSNANTVIGYNALGSNATGSYNTACGAYALNSNTTGASNTASGESSLSFNTTGSGNTACGQGALYDNTTGSYNTATGDGALSASTTGGDNTANGYGALESVTAGSDNTASGFEALDSNSTGDGNTASGFEALFLNTTGYNSAASGYQALFSNTMGHDNTAIGAYALNANTTGAENIAIGALAGYNLTDGSYNIDIGDSGQDVAGETDTIRIGEAGVQAKTIIAGIRGITTGVADAVAVMIDSKGQLGTASSSRRYKENIADMGDASARLLSLRPVTFRYKKPYDNGEKPIQFGLIAEEVAKVFPELTVFNAKGQPETVKYDLLGALLLNEFLKEHRRVEDLGRSAAAQEKRISSKEQINNELAKRVAAQDLIIADQQKQIQALTASMAKMTQQIDKVAQRLDGKDYQPVDNRIGSGPGE